MTSGTPIYLDHAATTPVDPTVRTAMMPFLRETYGNPSSVHRVGQAARRAIDTARDQIAATVGADSSEIYFTSGGTEANSLAILGTLLAARERGRYHVITTNAEHHAVLDNVQFAKTLGFSVTILPVDRYGQVQPEAVEEALTDRTALVSVMHANNEVGTVNPISKIALATHARGALFHTDAVQTYGAYPLAANTLGADLMTLSAHKIHGPKGVGALYIRRGVRVTPWIQGGMQEREKRAGTENVAGIVGFGRAAEILSEWRDTTTARLAPMRDAFIACFPSATLNGHPTERLPGNINLSFPDADGEGLLLALDIHGICASSGSACASGSIDPSHVLLAMGVPFALAQAAVRFSLGRATTDAELEQAVPIIHQLTRKPDGFR